MIFTKKQKNDYLDRLALLTQQQIWEGEMAILRNIEQLELKKALLTQTEDEQERTHLEEKIGELETEIQSGSLVLKEGAEDLELIERYRNQ